jgi:hypothetical protein
LFLLGSMAAAWGEQQQLLLFVALLVQSACSVAQPLLAPLTWETADYEVSAARVAGGWGSKSNPAIPLRTPAWLGPTT